MRLIATVGAVEPSLECRPVSGFLPDDNSVVGTLGTGESGCWPLSKRVAEPLGVFRLEATRPDGIAVDEGRRSPFVDCTNRALDAGWLARQSRDFGT